MQRQKSTLMQDRYEKAYFQALMMELVKQNENKAILAKKLRIISDLQFF